MKYKASRDLPQFVEEYKTLSASKLADIILRKRNAKVTPQSVTMWFKRHREVYHGLNERLLKELPSEKEPIEDGILESKNFRELTSVKKWIQVLHSRELGQPFIQAKLTNLKNSCRGTLHDRDLVAEGKWCLKHPDRLNFNDLLEMNATCKTLGFDTYEYKRDLKDFLENVREIPVGKKITVGKHRSFGKYAKLFVTMDKLTLMLNDSKARNYVAYAADLFMLKTATRSGATFSALIEDFYVVAPNATLTVFDKGRKSKYPKGHPWDKRIDGQLLPVLLRVIGERKSGRVFEGLGEDELRNLNREMIKKYAPEVLVKYPDVAPNHFWRHMFAQHMLRQTHWNYAVVAALGGWTPQALQESYGMPPDEEVKQWADKFQLNIQVVTVC